MGDPSEAFGRSRADLWRTSGASLEAFELPERPFGLDLHGFSMRNKDPGDLKNSVVFLLDGRPLRVSLLRSLSQQNVFGRTCVT